MFKVNPKEFKKVNLPVTVRFTEDLHKELHDYAAKYGVSFNYLVLKCCRYALDHAEDNKESNQ